MPQPKDLFDDSTMTFGEHLEVLRVHLFKAIAGLVICVIGSLFFGQQLVGLVRAPIDYALAKHGIAQTGEDITDFDPIQYFKSMFSEEAIVDREGKEAELEIEEPEEEPDPETIVVQMKASDLRSALAKSNPGIVKGTTEEAEEGDGDPVLRLHITAPEFAQLKRAVREIDKPKTFNVQEAFMTFLKVSIVFGLVLASPWVLYQIWLFVAAGLYPHERKYVYMYLPLSIFLFLGGAIFCFFAVFPFVLNFLLRFNTMLGVQPQIRLSEWISFAISLPVMFGVGFQLPLVMLFLERINVFEIEDFRTKRKFAILAIAFISMVLTPPDPMSMLMMMFPMLLLYEFGIILCTWAPTKTPFEEEVAY